MATALAFGRLLAGEESRAGAKPGLGALGEATNFKRKLAFLSAKKESLTRDTSNHHRFNRKMLKKYESLPAEQSRKALANCVVRVSSDEASCLQKVLCRRPLLGGPIHSLS